jgi:hypothetical protein
MSDVTVVRKLCIYICIFWVDFVLRFKNFLFIFKALFAGVAKLVDALALGASAERHGGSSPLSSTRKFFISFVWT